MMGFYHIPIFSLIASKIEQNELVVLQKQYLEYFFCIENKCCNVEFSELRTLLQNSAIK